MPAHVLAAMAAEGQTPPVSQKPGVDFCGFTERQGARTGKKGVKITRHTGRVFEQVPGAAFDKEPSIRVGDQPAAGSTLIDLCAVTAYSVWS